MSAQPLARVPGRVPPQAQARVQRQLRDVGRKPPQRKARTGYLKTLDELRDGVASADLIELLQRIWSSSGLEEWHGKQTKTKNDKKAPAVSAAARRKQEEEDELV